MRRYVVVVSVVALAAVALLGYGLVHGFGPRPVSSDGPPRTLPVLTSGSPCLSGRSPGPGGLFWVGVDDDPRSVTAVWWPTANDDACRVAETHGDRAAAEALATAVRTAPARFTGTVNCPADVGGAVDLYFAYRKGWERVRVLPTGCAEVVAAGRSARRWLGDDSLATLKPAGEWSKILR
jgi:hypothetical protein